MRIRQATTNDFSSIMDLYHEASDAMAGTPYDCCWRRDGHPSPDFVHGLISGNGMLVAEEKDELIGAIGVNHDLGHDYEDVMWLANVSTQLVCAIHLLVVRMGQRGQGLARTILRECLMWAANKGMCTARLDATANNEPAIALYQSEGFALVGKGDLDVNPDDDSLVPFVVMERLL